MKFVYTMIDPAYGEFELLYKLDSGEAVLKNRINNVIRFCNLKNYKQLKVEFTNERPEFNYCGLTIL